MKRYQVVTCSRKYRTAASKAVEDVASILGNQLGYETLVINTDEQDNSTFGKIKRQIICFFSWMRLYSDIEKDSILLMQHPFYHKQFLRERVLRALKDKKHIKYISLVHDVSELRKAGHNDYFEKEFSFMIEISDAIIVHNASMREFFVSKGISESKLIDLEIFDYLCAENTRDKANDKKLIIAGNLNPEKVEYLKYISDVKNIRFDLYGPGFDEDSCSGENIIYHGSMEPESLPVTFDGGFGLVWDGDSVDTCHGCFGEYLKYNNPHKLSLYLAAGIPTVIWTSAAESVFVKREEVGLAVSSIQDAADRINQISAPEYEKLARNAKEVSHRLRNGYYTSQAVRKAEAIVHGCTQK